MPVKRKKEVATSTMMTRLSKRRITHPGRRDPGSKIPTSFLDIPPEIRNRIYRLLLRNPSPIGQIGIEPWRRQTPDRLHAVEWDAVQTCDLQTAILRTSRQIYGEASYIFHRENTFGIWIWDNYSHQYHAEKDKAAKASEGLQSSNQFASREVIGHPLVRKLGKFQIVIDRQNFSGIYPAPSLESHVRTVCERLATATELHQVHILVVGDCSEDQTYLRNDLESFTLLRNVHHVVINGVQPRIAHYLKDFMEGRDDLVKKYQALKKLVGCFSGDLEQAEVAACDWNREDFISSRQRILDKMQFAVAHLFDDGDVELEKREAGAA